MAARLELRQISLVLGETVLLAGLDLTVAPEHVTTLMGPSGCGKSSLLGYICGTLAPAFRAGGRVFVDGDEVTDLPPERRRIGILFQDDMLFPHMSVGENLAFGLPPGLGGRRRRGRRRRARRVEAALGEAGLEGMAERDPATLSGGQRGRVAVMRTLLSEPRALLLDEPFSSLDVALRERFRRFVFDHARMNAIPTLLVTHDPADAASAGGPIVEFTAPTAALPEARPRVRAKPA